MFRSVFAGIVAVAHAEYTCPTKPPAGVARSECSKLGCPNVEGGKFLFIGGVEKPYNGKVTTVYSPVFVTEGEGAGDRMPIGTLPDMQPEHALEAVNAAAAAWDKGQGVWPQMSLAERIAAIERVVESLREQRSELVDVLMWEIAKSAPDAAKEFDRTMDFVAAAIEQLKKDPTMGQGFSEWGEVSGVGVRVRRGPIGVMLGRAPLSPRFEPMADAPIPASAASTTERERVRACVCVCVSNCDLRVCALQRSRPLQLPPERNVCDANPSAAHGQRGGAQVARHRRPRARAHV